MLQLDEHGLIQVVQLPVIEENLRKLNSYITQMTEEAKSLACTEETLQGVRARRSELTKFYSALEEQRKEVKNAIMAPYNAFEAVYKECVTIPFKEADSILTEKIRTVEGDIKARAQAQLEAYFEELKQAAHLPWLRFDQSGVKVGLTAAKGSLRKERGLLKEFVDGVESTVQTICEMPDSAEILAEYKSTLSLNTALATVNQRHRLIAEAAKQAPAPLIPPPASTPEPEMLTETEPRLSLSLTLTGTRKQLAKVREFLKETGVEYVQCVPQKGA